MLSYNQIETSSATANKKMDELIEMLEDSNLDNEAKISLQKRFNDAVDNSKSISSFRAFKVIGKDDDVSRVDMANNLEFLLSQHDLDSNMSKRYLVLENARLIVQVVISLTMIALGFGMIIIPAPPNFEMYTIFYFTTNDGVTIMDVISLLIVFTGVYLLISSFLKLGKK